MDKTKHISKGTPKKMEMVTSLTDKAGRAKSIVFADYRGLKHKQMEELRKLLKKVEGEIVVAKNRLMKRALGDRAASVENLLSDTTAALFSYADEVAALKELAKFLKAAGVGKTKGGLLGDTVLTGEEVDRLSALPTREVLLGRLVSQLNSPIQGLHYALSWNMNKLVWALSALKDKKGGA
jgi:large subunit ribosomal protein L10